MKNTLISLAAILLSFSLILPTFAQRQAPKTTDLPPNVTEGPGVQQEKSKATTSPGGRKSKKKDIAIDERRGKTSERPPTGIEGPETRKAEPKRTKEPGARKELSPKAGSRKPSSDTIPAPVGTEGPETRKAEQKKAQ